MISLGGTWNRKGRAGIILLAVLFLAGPAAPSEERAAIYDQGFSRLDAGSNLAAARWAEEQRQSEPSRLEHLDILRIAADRLCAADSVLTGLDGGGHPPDASRFIDGMSARNRYHFSAAATAFETAAKLSLARQDTLSALTGLLNAADCLLQDRNTVAATTVVEQMESLVGAFLPDRAALEVQARRGRVLILAGANSDAEPLYRDILAQAEKAGFRALVREGLDGIAAALVQQSRRGEAIPYYRASLVEADILGDGYNQCRMLINLAYNLANRTDNSEPRRLLDDAEARLLACENTYLLGHVDGTRAVCSEGEVNRPEAIELFQSAADQHAAVGNRTGELGSRQRMAFNLSMQGRLLEARTNYETCLRLMDGEESNWIANWVLWGLANVHRNLGDLDAALVYYDRTLAVSRGLGSQMTVAGVLSETGLVQARLGRYRQAIILHHEALEIMQELGATREAARVTARIGDAYYQLGNLNEALDYYQQSYEITSTLDSRLNLSDGVGGLAAIHGQAGNHEQAAAGFREALEIARDLDDQEAVVWALLGLAEQEILAGNKAGARVALAEAEGRLTTGGHYHDRARIALLQARLADDPGLARDLASDAVELAREGGLAADQWECLSDLGQYQYALGDTAAAKASQLAAMEGVESLWLMVGAEELRRHLLGPAGVPYSRMVNLLYDQGDSGTSAREALEIAERSRARALSHRLAMAGSRQSTWFGGGLDDEAREIAAAIAQRQSRLQEADLAEAMRDSLKGEIAALERDFRVARLENGSAGDAAAGVPGGDSGDVLGGVAPGETVLFFFLAEERSFLFSAREGEVRAWPLPGSREIENRVRMYLGLWTQMNRADSSPGGMQNVSGIDFAAASAGLFRYLIGPAGAEVARAEKIVIVPDGLLHRLPFAALVDGDGRGLGERSLFLAPSLEVLAKLRAAPIEDEGPAHREELDVIAVGCGLTGEGNAISGQRVNPFTDQPLVGLPHAEAEARDVARRFPRAQLRTGSAATEAGFRELSAYRTDILHIAAHGVADEKEVRRSFVVLNPPDRADESDRLDDGILQWYEAASLDLDAGLVTLSSCSSASGVLAKGEGVTGLTQAFLFAGTRCVLATLTDVPDSYAASFMADFYASFKKGSTAAVSLREAVARARDAQGGGDHRPLWASFTLVGDGGITISDPGGGGGLLSGRNIVILLGLGAVAAVLIRRRAW